LSRCKGGSVTHRRHKKLLDADKVFFCARSSNFRTATQAVDKANLYATRDR
jgi:large subunit ribosomal protein L20